MGRLEGKKKKKEKAMGYCSFLLFFFFLLVKSPFDDAVWQCYLAMLKVFLSAGC
jgi:uncharacterized membrane protein